ncbi:MAG: ArsR/SmtB family transcription factor [Acidimicrobiia bacterium]
MNEVVNQNRVFEVLANEHRREIIQALSLQPHSISQLAGLRGLSLPAIHKHVMALESAELVVRKKVGRTNFLALNRVSLRSVQQWLQQFNLFWGDESETLENYALHLGTDNPSEEGQQ